MKAWWESNDPWETNLRLEARLSEWRRMLNTDKGIATLKGMVDDAERLQFSVQGKTAPATYLGEIPPK